MRTLLLTALVLLLAVVSSPACDRCGCSLSGHYLSALPQYQRHVVGARWFYRSFETEHHGEEFSSDRFHSAEIWARMYPAKRLQLLGVLPLNFFSKKTASETLRRQGFGDAVLLANYNLLQNAWGADAKWRQALYLGGGVKLPTGKFDPELVEQNINPNLQPGTGSLDVLLSGSYTLRYGEWGFNANALYRFSGENSENFRFGDRLNLSGRLFYWTQTGRISWLPSLGLSHEWAAEDYSQGQRVYDTGGYCAFATAGIDAYLGSLALSLQWDLPAYQHLGNGYIHAGQRVQLGLSYLF